MIIWTARQIVGQFVFYLGTYLSHLSLAYLRTLDINSSFFVINGNKELLVIFEVKWSV